MYKKITSLLVVSIVFLSHISCTSYLPVPRSLQIKPVYYERAEQLDGFSCGYNVLYNAIELEARHQYPQKYLNISLFKEICLPYIRSQGKHPMDSSHNKMLDTLAQLLQLQPFAYLRMENNQIQYAPPYAVKIYYPRGASESYKKALFAQEYERVSAEKLVYMHNHLDWVTTARPQIIHFACHINTERGHVILISVVNDGLKKRLYIKDNMNASITEKSQAKQYIDFICQTCDVSFNPQRLKLTQAEAFMHSSKQLVAKGAPYYKWPLKLLGLLKKTVLY